MSDILIQRKFKKPRGKSCIMKSKKRGPHQPIGGFVQKGNVTYDLQKEAQRIKATPLSAYEKDNNFEDKWHPEYNRPVGDIGRKLMLKDIREYHSRDPNWTNERLNKENLQYSAVRFMTVTKLYHYMHALGAFEYALKISFEFGSNQRKSLSYHDIESDKTSVSSSKETCSLRNIDFDTQHYHSQPSLDKDIQTSLKLSFDVTRNDDIPLSSHLDSMQPQNHDNIITPLDFASNNLPQSTSSCNLVTVGDDIKFGESDQCFTSFDITPTEAKRPNSQYYNLNDTNLRSFSSLELNSNPHNGKRLIEHAKSHSTKRKRSPRHSEIGKRLISRPPISLHLSSLHELSPQGVQSNSLDTFASSAVHHHTSSLGEFSQLHTPSVNSIENLAHLNNSHSNAIDSFTQLPNTPNNMIVELTQLSDNSNPSTLSSIPQHPHNAAKQILIDNLIHHHTHGNQPRKTVDTILQRHDNNYNGTLEKLTHIQEEPIQTTNNRTPDNNTFFDNNVHFNQIDNKKSTAGNLNFENTYLFPLNHYIDISTAHRNEQTIKVQTPINKAFLKQDCISTIPQNSHPNNTPYNYEYPNLLEPRICDTSTQNLSRQRPGNHFEDQLLINEIPPNLVSANLLDTSEYDNELNFMADFSPKSSKKEENVDLSDKFSMYNDKQYIYEEYNRLYTPLQKSYIPFDLVNPSEITTNTTHSTSHILPNKTGIISADLASSIFDSFHNCTLDNSPVRRSNQKISLGGNNTRHNISCYFENDDDSTGTFFSSSTHHHNNNSIPSMISNYFDSFDYSNSLVVEDITQQGRFDLVIHNQNCHEAIIREISAISQVIPKEQFDAPPVEIK